MCDDLRWNVITLNGTRFLWVFVYIFVSLCYKQKPYLLTKITLTPGNRLSLWMWRTIKPITIFFFFRKRNSVEMTQTKEQPHKKIKSMLENGLNVCCYQPSNYKPCLCTDWILSCFFLAFDFDCDFSILWNCLKIWRTLSIVDELILSQLAFNHDITSWHLSIYSKHFKVFLWQTEKKSIHENITLIYLTQVSSRTWSLWNGYRIM